MLAKETGIFASCYICRGKKKKDKTTLQEINSGNNPAGHTATILMKESGSTWKAPALSSFLFPEWI